MELELGPSKPVLKSLQVVQIAMYIIMTYNRVPTHSNHVIFISFCSRTQTNTPRKCNINTDFMFATSLFERCQY